MRLPVKKSCCRKAFLLGLLCAARSDGERGLLYLYGEELAELAQNFFQNVFHTAVERKAVVRAGRKANAISFDAPSAMAFLHAWERTPELAVDSAVGFRCAACAQHFMRGVFLSCATVTDPKKGYHMEFLFPTRERADAIAAYLSQTVGAGGRTRRGERFGICYKSNGAISDLLYWIGCPKTGFAVTNASIEREIRNNENRATNCVAHNIARSVGAAQKQRSAIERLREARKLDALSEELRTTAYLRLEHEEASLTELALMHEPPLTKSGLNRRLARLMELAEEISEE